MATRKEQAAQSRMRLLNAARQLIIDQGYDKISIVDITNASGMSVGNFYHYFKSKEDLIRVLEMEAYGEDMQILQQKKDEPVEEQISFYMKSYTQLMTQTFGQLYDRQWLIYYLNNPTPLDDPQNKVNLIIDAVKGFLTSAMEKGELSGETPADDIATEIALSITGANVYYCMTNGQFDADAWCDKFCNEELHEMLLKWYIS